MNVFVAGSTGVLGRRVVTDLIDRDHRVVGLTRDRRGDALIESLGAHPVRGDLFDPESMTRAAAGADVIVHAATAIPTKTKPSIDDWRENDRIRVEGTKALIDAARNVNATKLILQSIVWVARQPDGSWFDEDATPRPDRTAQSAVEAEQLVQRAANERGLDVSILRCGLFYAPDAAHTQAYVEMLQQGKLPVIGGGLLGRHDALLSYIHVDDAARAFADAVDADRTGLWHVVDDEPAAMADLFTHMAELMGARQPRRIPGWLAKGFVGADAVSLMTRAMPTSNARVRRDLGWSPTYPSYREGLAQVIRAWNGEAAQDPDAVPRST